MEQRRHRERAHREGRGLEAVDEHVVGREEGEVARGRPAEREEELRAAQVRPHQRRRRADQQHERPDAEEEREPRDLGGREQARLDRDLARRAERGPHAVVQQHRPGPPRAPPRTRPPRSGSRGRRSTRCGRARAGRPRRSSRRSRGRRAAPRRRSRARRSRGTTARGAPRGRGCPPTRRAPRARGRPTRRCVRPGRSRVAPHVRARGSCGSGSGGACRGASAAMRWLPPLRGQGRARSRGS